MRTLAETLQENSNQINEASHKYLVIYLSADSGSWEVYEDEEFELSDLEEQMYEESRELISASNFKAAIKKVQKKIDKYDDPRDCIAASVYDGEEQGPDVETIYSKAWMDLIDEVYK